MYGSILKLNRHLLVLINILLLSYVEISNDNHLFIQNKNDGLGFHYFLLINVKLNVINSLLFQMISTICSLMNWNLFCHVRLGFNQHENRIV
jgi:hypothetical protein